MLILLFSELVVVPRSLFLQQIRGKGRKGMSLFWKLGTLTMHLILVTKSCGQSSSDLNDCEIIVKNWAKSSSANGIKEDKLSLKDLLFFLHVPRTGGRTYYHCFLKKLYTVDQKCPISYDKLHFNPRKSNCRLLVTHDDYSLMSKFPVDRTSVVTVLRNPIDRVFSTYEFAVEVAARFLVHPNLTSAIETSQRARRGVSTLDIWPWKYLVPWMREDLFSRRDVRKHVKHKRAKDVSGNPYDMEDMVMPLHEFMNDPIAHEIVHNGETFQVAGITNNSISDEAHAVRLCVKDHSVLGQYVVEVAKSRLDHMLYIGLTEDHKESATMFANLVGAQALSQLQTVRSHLQQKNFSENEIEMKLVDDTAVLVNQVEKTNSQQVGDIHSLLDEVAKNRSMAVEELMKEYEGCISGLRMLHGSRRSMSFKTIAPANFSKEARLLVPEKLVKEILSLNSLDVHLYKHAQDIFMQQRKHLMENSQGISKLQNIQVLPEVESEGLQAYMHGGAYWNAVSTVVSACFMVILILLVVTVKSRSSKHKIYKM